MLTCVVESYGLRHVLTCVIERYGLRRADVVSLTDVV
jgi:hypothetical protein